MKSINYLHEDTKQIDLIKSELDQKGYCYVKDFPVSDDLELTSKRFELFCATIGEPVAHDENGKIVWDIKKSEQSQSAIQTYSEHDGEAQLHTDSQYREHPEHYFGLLCLKKANCGGGTSYLLTIDDILDELKAVDSDDSLLNILKSYQYPFIVPTVFQKDRHAKVEFVYGPIFDNDHIRFRVDTLKKALNHHQIPQEALTAIDTLMGIICNSVNIKELILKPGELLLINNRTVLHGRSAFIDTSRHLLRVRMNGRDWS